MKIKKCQQIYRNDKNTTINYDKYVLVINILERHKKKRRTVSPVVGLEIERSQVLFHTTPLMAESLDCALANSRLLVGQVSVYCDSVEYSVVLAHDLVCGST